MHEFAIAQDIVSSLEIALKEDFKMISSIDIEAGAFAGIVADSLIFGLETILSEMQINNVRINIDQSEAEALCECGTTYRLENIFELCPDCGSAGREMKSGTELSVRSVNIRDGNNE